MGVSENNGFPPKSSHFFGGLFHDFHHPFWGFSPYFWKHLPYHHIIKLPILKPPHGATTKVATSAWTTNHHCIAPPFFFGAFTDPERMDIGPIWMFHLTSQMRWKRMWWKTWGIFVRKKTRVFCWSSVSGFIGQPFLGGNSTKKSARFRFQKGMKIALSLTTHFVKTTWRLDHTLWSVGSSCWWIWMGFWPIDHDKKTGHTSEFKSFSRETLPTWKTQAVFKVNTDSFVKFSQAWMVEHVWDDLPLYKGTWEMLAIYIVTLMFLSILEQVVITYIYTFKYINTYIDYLQYTVQSLASFAFANYL